MGKLKLEDYDNTSTGTETVMNGFQYEGVEYEIDSEYVPFWNSKQNGKKRIKKSGFQ